MKGNIIQLETNKNFLNRAIFLKITYNSTFFFPKTDHANGDETNASTGKNYGGREN